MTTIHKCSMLKSEFVTLVIAGVIASFAFYEYEQKQTEQSTTSQHQSDHTIQAEKVGKAPDFANIQNTKQKKQAFFEFLKPGIALENQRIEKERKRLEKIASAFKEGSVTSEHLSYAQRLSKLYNVEMSLNGIDQEWLNTMLHRVDVLPAALVLVQAANESAWGTSRFATQANNYFGQWCYSKGCGLVPLKRKDGMSHEVAKFNSVQQSIYGYFMNVNRNNAYQALREIRYQRHLSGKSLTDTDAAIALTEGLTKYSERGEAYVNDLKAMIRHNRAFWEQTSTQQ